MWQLYIAHQDIKTYTSWSFRGEKIQWDLLGQTDPAKRKNVPTFQNLTLSHLQDANSDLMPLKMGAESVSETSEHFYSLTRLSVCPRRFYWTLKFVSEAGRWDSRSNYLNLINMR
jgi:hypothetical protein